MASESLDIGDEFDNKVKLIKNHCKLLSGIKLKIKLMPLPYESGNCILLYLDLCVLGLKTTLENGPVSCGRTRADSRIKNKSCFKDIRLSMEGPFRNALNLLSWSAQIKDRLSKTKEHTSSKQNSGLLDTGYLNAVSFECA